MRDVVAWCLRRARTWVALVAATVATVLASGDGKAGWTATVALSTYGLALLSIRAHWLDEHPDRPDRRQVKHDEMVERALRRYRGEPDPPPRHRAAPSAREPVSPAVRRRRAAVAAALVATPLAAVLGGRPAALVVGVVTFGLAAWSLGRHVVATRPEREARRQAKYEAWVEKTLREYRGRSHADAPPGRRRPPRRPPPVRPVPPVVDTPADRSREERRVAEIVRRYERQTEARLAARRDDDDAATP